MRKQLLILFVLFLVSSPLTACAGKGACDLDAWLNSSWGKPIPEIGSPDWKIFERAAQNVGFTPKKLKQFLHELDQNGSLCELPRSQNAASVPETKDQDTSENLKIAQIAATAIVLIIILLVLLAFFMGRKPPPDFA